jgi:ankyrin repeat protein
MSCAPYLVTLVALLLFPASISAQEASPQWALWDGAIQGDTVAMAAALDRGAAIDSLDTRRNRNGRRALNWAAWHDQVPAIRFLLAHGADIEARNRTGFTAFHHAAESGSMDAARALLEAGADPGARNNAGHRPIDTAREEGRSDVVRLLESRQGAN